MTHIFGVPIIPANDKERLIKLNSFFENGEITETGTFRHVATLARQIFNTPIALVSFVDKEKVFFAGNTGMGGVNEAERGVSLCSLAILSCEVTVFENAKEEPCLMANPFVSGSLGLKFYAGAPIKTNDGFNIGVVCVADRKPRTFTKADIKLLESLASAVMDELEAMKV